MLHVKPMTWVRIDVLSPFKSSKIRLTLADHRKILFREFEFFMETSEAEQRARLSPELPSTEAYMKTRMGTSAVNVTTFFNE